MTTTFVYVIVSGDFVKIGMSRDPEKRAAELRTGAAQGVSVFYTRKFPNEATARKVERRAHALLHPFRQSGEWFNCSPARARLTVSKVKVDAAKPIRLPPRPPKEFTPADSIDDVLREIAREKIRKAMGWEGDFPVYVNGEFK